MRDKYYKKIRVKSNSIIGWIPKLYDNNNDMKMNEKN